MDDGPDRINIIEFQQKLADRIEWIRENHPELLERTVTVATEDGAYLVTDVFVEHGIVISGELIE